MVRYENRTGVVLNVTKCSYGHATQFKYPDGSAVVHGDSICAVGVVGKIRSYVTKVNGRFVRESFIPEKGMIEGRITYSGTAGNVLATSDNRLVPLGELGLEVQHG